MLEGITIVESLQKPVDCAFLFAEESLRILCLNMGLKLPASKLTEEKLLG